MKKTGLTYGLIYFTKEQMNVLNKVACFKNAEWWWFDSVEGNSAWYYDIRNLLTDFDYNNAGFSPKEIAFLDECKKNIMIMNAKDLEKAKELASILVADDQNNKPLVDLLLKMAEWKDEQIQSQQSQQSNKKKANEISDNTLGSLEYQCGAYEGAMQMAEWKDKQTILEQSCWCFDKPTKNCFVLLLTKEFPKNCFYVVAEWDNDAQCFYSEATDYPIEKWDCWKMLEENLLLENKNYKEEVEYRKKIK